MSINRASLFLLSSPSPFFALGLPFSYDDAIYACMCAFLYVSPCTFVRLRRLWELGNRRTRRDERARSSIDVPSSSLLRSAAYLYSRRIKRRTANSRTRHGRVKGTLESLRKKQEHFAHRDRRKRWKKLFSHAIDLWVPKTRYLSFFLSLPPICSRYYIIFAHPLWNETFTRAKLSRSILFSLSSTINWPV